MADQAKRTTAQTWRPTIGAEDTAPPAARQPSSDPADWGVTAAEARALLGRQMCPVCGEGPWKSPLNHVSRKHGIDRFTMRDVCGLVLSESVADPQLSAHFSELRKGADMSAIIATGPGSRRKYRHTQAGASRLVANIEAFNDRPDAADISRENVSRTKSPEALAKRAATIRQRWAELTPEERAARMAHLDMSAEKMAAMNAARWEKSGRQPCGTVAAYKRGCRCDGCREAKRESRRR